VKFRRCPSSHEIVRFFESDAPDALKKRALEHVKGCPECRFLFAAAREIRERGDAVLDELGALDLRDAATRARLRSLARRELRRVRGAARPAWPRRFAIPAAAAALLFAAGFVVLPLLREARVPAVERNAGGSAVELVAPHGAVPAGPVNFTWEATPGIHMFRLEIYDPSLELVFVSPTLGAAQFTLTRETGAALRRDTPYFWKVVATGADGKKTESEFGKFLVQR